MSISTSSPCVMLPFGRHCSNTGGEGEERWAVAQTTSLCRKPLFPSFPTLDYSGHYEFSSLGPGVQSLRGQVLCPWHGTPPRLTFTGHHPRTCFASKELAWFFTLNSSFPFYYFGYPGPKCPKLRALIPGDSGGKHAGSRNLGSAF